jgi:pimeloyl-ACP methyl ester carboxylesterase
VSSRNRYWRDPALGEPTEVETSGGKMRAFSTGSGEPIVFVHGALVNANLWRKVVPLLAADFRCVTLDLPLGSHELAMPEADLSPTGLADLIAEAIRGLGVDRPTVVGNDTGGGLCQLVVTRRPERIGRLVLTSCDAFDQFPPKLMRPLMPVLSSAALLRLALAPARAGAVQRAVFKTVAKRQPEPEVLDSYTLPAITSPGVRRDLARFSSGIEPRYMLEAAERLPAFDKPALIAWSREDVFFPDSHGERLAELLPQGRLEWIEDARTFSPEDQPARIGALVAELSAAVPAR